MAGFNDLTKKKRKPCEIDPSSKKMYCQVLLSLADATSDMRDIRI